MTAAVLHLFTMPGGWPFLLLVVFWIALGWIAIIRRAWPFYFSPKRVRIDEDLAQRDREARTYARVNSLRSLSTPAPKGFDRHRRQHCAAIARPMEPADQTRPPAPSSISDFSPKGFR